MQRCTRRVIGAIAALAAAGALLAPAAGASTAEPTWVKLHPALSPPPLYGAAMAYDPPSQLVVLYGGMGKNGLSSTTWAWDGSSWFQPQTSASPPPLYGATMFYDSTYGGIVLFGGIGKDGPLSGTWVWDYFSWEPLSSTVHPPASAFSATIGGGLFGGVGATGQPLSGTWGGPGLTTNNWWQGPSSPPSPRYGAAAAYDQATSQVIMFGGHSATSYLAGTWAWGSSGWAQDSPTTSPPASYGGSAGYYGGPGTDQLILFGGVSASGYLAGTWAWDGSNWSQLSPAEHPSARYEAAMAYDSAADELVLFGGTGPNGPLNDTWAWKVPTWRPT
jgi:hypothetical protein